MNAELSAIFSLKKVLELAGEGMGMAQSLVRELRTLAPEGSEVARMVLLGYPLAVSLRPLAESRSEEVSMLTSLVVSAQGSSSALVGRNGSAFAATLERWVKARENGRLEMKVQRFRSLVTSGVLGAVTAMIAALGPLVGNRSFLGTAPDSGTGALMLAAAGMTAISSGMLGYFMSGRRFYQNVVVALLVFAFVDLLASPLANISPLLPVGR